MSEPQSTVAADDAAGGQFAKAFLPGLVLGLVVGLFIGAWIPPFFGAKPDLIQSQPPATTRTPEQRHADEAALQHRDANEAQPQEDHNQAPPPPEGGQPEESPANPG